MFLLAVQCDKQICRVCYARLPPRATNCVSSRPLYRPIHPNTRLPPVNSLVDTTEEEKVRTLVPAPTQEEAQVVYSPYLYTIHLFPTLFRQSGEEWKFSSHRVVYI